MTNKMKKCVNCEQEFPRTEEFFYKREDFTYKSGYRFSPRCRECQRVYNAMMKREQRKRDKKNNVKREFI